MYRVAHVVCKSEPTSISRIELGPIVGPGMSRGDVISLASLFFQNLLRRFVLNWFLLYEILLFLFFISIHSLSTPVS